MVGVRFTTPWPRALTQGLSAQDESLATVRTQNLVVSWRRDAELALAALEDARRVLPAAFWVSQRSTARAAYARGAYADAYRRANAGLGAALPATFVVKQSSALAPYAVRIETRRPVSATVYQWSRSRVRVYLWDEAATACSTPVTLRVGGRMPGAVYTARQTRPGEWLLERAGRSGQRRLIASRAGELTLSVLPPTPARRTSASTVAGVFRQRAGRVPGSADFVVVPGDGSSRALIRTDARTVIWRGEAGAKLAPATLADLRPGDQIEGGVGPGGTATHVAATFRSVTGTVRAFGQLSPRAMPFVVVGDALRTKHVLDLSAPLHTPRQKGIVLKTLPLGAIDVAPGDTVTLRVNPVSGRAYELWSQAGGEGASRPDRSTGAVCAACAFSCSTRASTSARTTRVARGASMPIRTWSPRTSTIVMVTSSPMRML